MHCAVVGYVNLIFAEAAEDELLNIGRANVQVSLAVSLEV